MKKMTCFLLFALTSFTFAADREVNKTFAVNPDATLSLDSHKGKITIRPHAADEIVVNARIYMSGYGTEKMSSGDVDRLIDAVEVRFADSASSVRVEVDYHAAQSIFDALMMKDRVNPTVDFEVFVPVAANLKLESHKGEMDITAPSGAVDIESHKGSGVVTGVRGPLELQTHKGNFDVTVETLKDLDIETHKGDVKLTILGAADFNIKADSHKGNFHFNGRDIPLNRGKRHGVGVSYSEGSGAHGIRIETHKGNITINFED